MAPRIAKEHGISNKEHGTDEGVYTSSFDVPCSIFDQPVSAAGNLDNTKCFGGMRFTGFCRGDNAAINSPLDDGAKRLLPCRRKYFTGFLAMPL